MKRAIAIGVLIAIVLTFGILEEIYVRKTVKELYNLTQEIYLSVEANEEELNTKKNNDMAQELYDFWIKSESILCLLVNYESIKSISESICKLQTSLQENDLSVTYENITLLKNYSKILSNVLGFNVQNIL